MRRPFSTRARRGLMRLLYGVRGHPASAQAVSRRPSICLSQQAIWFQLTGGRDAISSGTVTAARFPRRKSGNSVQLVAVPDARRSTT
jgi:hypothetical protein